MTAVGGALLAVAALCAGTGLLVLRRRGAPAAPPTLAFTAALLVWTLAYVWEIQAQGLPTMLLAAKVQYLGIAVAPPFALWFAMRYTGRTRAAASRLLVLSLALPVVTVALAWTNESHGLVWSEVGVLPGRQGSTLIVSYGDYFVVHLVYSYFCLLAALALVVELSFRTSGLWFRRNLVVIVGLCAPWLANLLWISGLSPFGSLDPTVFAFGVTALAFGLASARLQLFSLAPLARDLLLGTIEDGIVVLDEQERVIDMNAAAGRFLDRSVGDSLGLDGRRILGAFEAALDQPEGATPLRLTSAGDERIYDCTRVALVPGDEEFGPVALLLRDVTDMARAQRDLEAQLRQAQRVETIGTFVGGIAHDFNNLLSAIMGFTEVALLDVPEDSSTAEDLAQVLSASHRAKDLVAQIMTFARDSESSMGPLSMEAAVDEALDMLHAVMSESVEVERHVEADLPEVCADPVQMQQVLMNLCINASHAMPRGGRLSVELEAGDGPALRSEESLAAQVEAIGWLRLRVRDDGCGMDEATLARIFDPFFTTKEASRGTGLGLSVVRGIVQSHGGEIAAESEPGVGTTFTVHLPVSACKRESEEDAAPPAVQVQATT